MLRDGNTTSWLRYICSTHFRYRRKKLRFLGRKGAETFTKENDRKEAMVTIEQCDQPEERGDARPSPSARVVDLWPAAGVPAKQLVEVPPTEVPLEGVAGIDSPITEKLPLLSSMRLLKSEKPNPQRLRINLARYNGGTPSEFFF